jgi:hypothetical protein
MILGERKPKLAVCLPALDSVATFFAYDYAGMIAYTARAGFEVGRLVARGTYLYEQRETLADAVLSGDYTHALWVDSDMRFPKDTYLRLLDRQLPIVGAGYPSRHAPFLPVVSADLRTDERVWTTRQHEGVAPVGGLGFGCLLTERSALEAVEKPRFNSGWNAELGQFLHEDMMFCFKAAKAGVPIHIDHDLTKVVKHIGSREYDFETSLIARESMEREDAPLIVGAK